jgi:hypothetical protein
LFKGKAAVQKLVDSEVAFQTADGLLAVRNHTGGGKVALLRSDQTSLYLTRSFFKQKF